MFAKIAMKQDSSKHLTLAAMSVGYGVVQLDVTIVNVAINSIGQSFGGVMGAHGLLPGITYRSPSRWLCWSSVRP
jgi:hypothetical protein